MNLKKLYSQVKISPLPWKERKWVLLGNCHYTCKSFWKPIDLYIDKGFVTDGASVPRILHIIGTPMWHNTVTPAVFHDMLYKKQILTREQSDQVFKEMMIVCQVGTIKRILFYLWVRAFWWMAWRQNKAKK